jgi:hypothetical protein
MLDDQNILQRIKSLVQEEHDLRSIGDDSARGGQNASRLQRLEEDLDQCWDLLRQRRAKSEFGEDPDKAVARPIKQVENYLPRK